MKTIGKQTGVRVQFAYEDVSAFKVSVKLTKAYSFPPSHVIPL